MASRSAILLDVMLGRMSALLTVGLFLDFASIVSLMVNQVVHLHCVGVSAVFSTILPPRGFRLLVRSFIIHGPIDNLLIVTIKFTSKSTHASTVDPRPKNQHKKAWERGYHTQAPTQYTHMHPTYKLQQLRNNYITFLPFRPVSPSKPRFPVIPFCPRGPGSPGNPAGPKPPYIIMMYIIRIHQN